MYYVSGVPSNPELVPCSGPEAELANAVLPSLLYGTEGSAEGATSENVFFHDFLVLWYLTLYRFSTQNLKNIFSVRNSKVSKL